MGEEQIIQVAIDVKSVLLVGGTILTFTCFLIVLVFKMAMDGLNKTITNCHGKLSSEHNNRVLLTDERHTNHEQRIHALEGAIFIPVNHRGGHGNNNDNG